MKILHVIFSFYTGGAETMLVDILNEQSKTEYVELIIVNNLCNADLINGIRKQVKIHYINRKEGSYNPLYGLNLNLLLFNIGPDVIHVHNPSLINLIKYKGSAQVCLTIHGFGLPLVNFNKYDKLFAISNGVRNDVKRRGNIDSIVIYNGIDFSKFTKKIKIQNSRFKIVQIGRLDFKIKGQDILLKAFSSLIHENKINNVQLDFIGEGTKMQLAYLQDLACELKIERYVHFLGLKSRTFVYSNLRDYDILVQPSLDEGFGLTIIEGIAAGLPVIVSNIDGPSEIVKDLPAGFIFEAGNVDSLVKELSLLINLYKKDKVEQLVNESYDKAFNSFSVQKTALNYTDNYMADNVQ